MLPKKHRLVKEKDFQGVFKKGKSFFTAELGIKVLANNLDVSRFGISVGLKISKKAVVRNKIKRRLREVFRLKLAQIKPGYDFVIIALPGIVDKKYQEIDEIAMRALDKFKMIKK